MSTLFVKNAQVLVTMDSKRREIAEGALLVRDNVIEAVGSTPELTARLEQSGQVPDETLNLTGHIVLPGLINTHHHMSQSLFRAFPGAQDADFGKWVSAQCKLWAGLTPDMIYGSALVSMTELILSGCTTTSDHLYIYPNGSRMDDEICAACEIGIRFHPGRGSLTIHGDVLPDSLIAEEAEVERDTIRLIDTYHDSERYSMLRIVVAPGSPFSVSHDFMRESAKLARSYKGRNVCLHTHFSQTDEENEIILAQTGLSSADYLEDIGWLGEDVWHAHCVCLDDQGIEAFSQTQTGIAHCPHSMMRLGMTLPHVPRWRKAGIRVGLGVDGSASNDGNHLIAEARQALMLARARTADPGALTVREVLEISTLGGATVLGRDDIGTLAPNMAADFISINLNRLEYAGGLRDPVACVLLCASVNVDTSVINGRVIVRDGHIMTVDVDHIVRQQNKAVLQLAAAYYT